MWPPKPISEGGNIPAQPRAHEWKCGQGCCWHWQRRQLLPHVTPLLLCVPPPPRRRILFPHGGQVARSGVGSGRWWVKKRDPTPPNLNCAEKPKFKNAPGRAGLQHKAPWRLRRSPSTAAGAHAVPQTPCSSPGSTSCPVSPMAPSPLSFQLLPSPMHPPNSSRH